MWSSKNHLPAPAVGLAMLFAVRLWGAAPSISSVDPTGVGAGSAEFDLTVSGTNFVQGSTITWNGLPVPTRLLANCGCVVGRVPSNLIPIAPGVVIVTVLNPDSTHSNGFLVNITSLAILNASRLPNAVVGQPYSVTLLPTGGISPYRFALYPDIGTGLPWAGFDGATLTGTPTAPGDFNFRVALFDSTCGSSSSCSLTNKDFTITVSAPSITAINPASATAGGPGFTLTVTGTSFPSSAVVRWNGTALTTTYVSATQLTATVPASLIAAPGTAAITVAAGSVTSNSAGFVVNPPPVIDSISPSTATAGGPGFTLTVIGTAFASGAVVQWNGSPLATTTVVANTRLSAAVPAGLISSAGTAQITVLSAGTVSNSATFTITPAPSISSLSPSSATAGGAAFTLTVNGSGFAAGAVVQWNGSALSTTFVSAIQLTAAVPATLIASAGTAAITVISSGVTSSGASFTIAAPPVITSLTPSSAATGGPLFNLTVSGSGFSAGAVVRWNTIPLSTTFVSAAQLTATVPASLIADAGTVTITVASGGVTSNGVAFTIGAGPAISSLSPASAVAGGPSFTLTVNGSGFAPGALVQWNGITLTAAFVNSAQLTVQVPGSLIAAPGTVSIVVVNPDQSATRPATFTVTVALPSISLTGLDSTEFPTQPLAVGVQLSGPAPVALAGTLTLSFRPAAAGVSPDYRDPALQFAAGGTTLNFSIPAGAASAVLPQSGGLQQGTVAGTITVTLTRLTGGATDVLPQPPPSRSATVRSLAPVILPDSVKIVNVRPGGFDVQLTAYSTPRDLTTGEFTFTAAAGAQIEGSATLSVNLANAAAQWYASDAGRASGSAFQMQAPFTLSGDPSALQSVTVKLSNSAGTSAAVRGGR